MPPADDLLRSLRGVFRGELEDHLQTLQREREVLHDEAAPMARREEGAREVFRALHSLKGAARAVDFPSIEGFCHALETRLVAVRDRPEALVSVAAPLVDFTLPVLHACAASLASRGVPDDEAMRAALGQLASAGDRAAPPAPVVQPPRRASQSFTAVVPAPATPQPARTAEPAQRPSTPDAAHDPRAGDTVRVGLDRIDALVSSAQEAISTAWKFTDRTAHSLEIEQSVSGVRDALRRARHALSLGVADVPAAAMQLDRALAFVDALTERTGVGASLRDEARRDLDAAGAQVLARSRSLRLQPFAALGPVLERAALDAAAQLQGAVEFSLEGGALELDRRVLDGLREPLLHLVRNAVDHGVGSARARAAQGKPPTGRIRVSASLQGSEARVEVRDDGAGIDPVQVRAAALARGVPERDLRDERSLLALLFRPGFSTRAEASSLSGRGVGLDVVRARVGSMHGRVELQSEKGAGTRVVLTVPVDLGVLHAVLARVGDAHVAFASTAITGLRRVHREDLTVLDGGLYLPAGGTQVPFVTLRALLGFGAPSASGDELDPAQRPCVLLRAGDRACALAVDALVDERELLVRPLGSRVRRVPFVSAVTTLHDGEVALLLDAGALVEHARPDRAEDVFEAQRPSRGRVLVVDDSITTRELERALLEAHGYEVFTAADGQTAWELLLHGPAVNAVISDIEMPRVTGLQLLSRVRAHPKTSRLPLVLVSALDSEADRAKAIELGAQAYVLKSRFDEGELLALLDALHPA